MVCGVWCVVCGVWCVCVCMLCMCVFECVCMHAVYMYMYWRNTIMLSTIISVVITFAGVRCSYLWLSLCNATIPPYTTSCH